MLPAVYVGRDKKGMERKASQIAKRPLVVSSKEAQIKKKRNAPITINATEKKKKKEEKKKKKSSTKQAKQTLEAEISSALQLIHSTNTSPSPTPSPLPPPLTLQPSRYPYSALQPQPPASMHPAPPPPQPPASVYLAPLPPQPPATVHPPPQPPALMDPVPPQPQYLATAISHCKLNIL